MIVFTNALQHEICDAKISTAGICRVYTGVDVRPNFTIHLLTLKGAEQMFRNDKMPMLQKCRWKTLHTHS